MKLYIKYMVSLRCKMLVKEVLKNKDLHYTTLDQGMIEITEELTNAETVQLKEDLRKSGLELLNDDNSLLIERIKSVIIEMIYYCEEFPKQDPAEYLVDKLKLDYPHMEAIFSEVKGVTIKQFIISLKIERIKEFILYDELSLEEIAEWLCYENVTDMSNQLEQFTGLNPSYFMEMKKKRKKNLEGVK